MSTPATRQLFVDDADPSITYTRNWKAVTLSSSEDTVSPVPYYWTVHTLPFGDAGNISYTFQGRLSDPWSEIHSRTHPVFE